MKDQKDLLSECFTNNNYISKRAAYRKHDKDHWEKRWHPRTTKQDSTN